MNGSLQIILRFIWDVVVLLSTVALAWRGLLGTEVVTAVIGLYAGLYGGAMRIDHQNGGTGKLNPLPSVVTAGIVVLVAMMTLIR